MPLPVYPSPLQLIGSERLELDGLIVERAVDGKPHFQDTHDRQYYQFKVVHELTSSELTTFKAFLATNKYEEILFNWAHDAVNYVVRFGGAPKQVPILGETRTKVEVDLIEIRDVVAEDT